MKQVKKRVIPSSNQPWARVLICSMSSLISFVSNLVLLFIECSLFPSKPHACIPIQADASSLIRDGLSKFACFSCFDKFLSSLLFFWENFFPWVLSLLFTSLSSRFLLSLTFCCVFLSSLPEFRYSSALSFSGWAWWFSISIPRCPVSCLTACAHCRKLSKALNFGNWKWGKPFHCH